MSSRRPFLHSCMMWLLLPESLVRNPNLLFDYAFKQRCSFVEHHTPNGIAYFSGVLRRASHIPATGYRCLIGVHPQYRVSVCRHFASLPVFLPSCMHTDIRLVCRAIVSTLSTATPRPHRHAFAGHSREQNERPALAPWSRNGRIPRATLHSRLSSAFKYCQMPQSAGNGCAADVTFVHASLT